jgi:uncharacterized protein (UPF0261 family)
MEWKSRFPIALVGTLDTKGEEILFLKQRLSAWGAEVLVIDVGVLGFPYFKPDVTREEIAASAGKRLEEVIRDGDRGRAVTAMESGCASWFRAHRSRVAGVLAIGGSAGTTIATAGMRALPTGLPKLMVSTLASANTRPYVGTSDIAMLYPVADFTGLNRLTRRILSNAAGAIAGMCSQAETRSAAEDERPVVAATMFGVTTPCVNRVRELIEGNGHEVLVFHATGAGGQAMEQLIRDGFFRGVFDLTTTELADELVGGVLSAGPHRLEAAGEAGIPQVISVGALDMVNFGPPDSVPERFRARKFYRHNPTVTLMRTTAEENARLGEIIAEKANAARGPVLIMLPLRGISAIDAAGQPFYDPRADGALFDAIRARTKVKVIELDVHINDPEFASCAVSELLRMPGMTLVSSGRNTDVIP